jgi:hypothetical protein
MVTFTLTRTSLAELTLTDTPTLGQLQVWWEAMQNDPTRYLVYTDFMPREGGGLPAHGPGGRPVPEASRLGARDQYQRRRRPRPGTAVSGGIRNIGTVNLTKSMANALGPYGINVNAVYPGQTITEATLERYAAQEVTCWRRWVCPSTPGYAFHNYPSWQPSPRPYPI